LAVYLAEDIKNDFYSITTPLKIALILRWNACDVVDPLEVRLQSGEDDRDSFDAALRIVEREDSDLVEGSFAVVNHHWTSGVTLLDNLHSIFMLRLEFENSRHTDSCHLSCCCKCSYRSQFQLRIFERTSRGPRSYCRHTARFLSICQCLKEHLNSNDYLNPLLVALVRVKLNTDAIKKCYHGLNFNFKNLN